MTDTEKEIICKECPHYLSSWAALYGSPIGACLVQDFIYCKKIDDEEE